MPKRRFEGDDDDHDDIEPKPIKICCEDKEKFMKKVLVEIKNCSYGKKDASCDAHDGKKLSALELHKKYRAHCTQSRCLKPLDNPEDKMFGVSIIMFIT